MRPLVQVGKEKGVIYSWLCQMGTPLLSRIFVHLSHLLFSPCRQALDSHLGLHWILCRLNDLRRTSHPPGSRPVRSFFFPIQKHNSIGEFCWSYNCFLLMNPEAQKALPRSPIRSAGLKPSSSPWLVLPFNFGCAGFFRFWIFSLLTEGSVTNRMGQPLTLIQ